MIISRTPYRISFFGGGTDYPAWYRQHGGAVLAGTIDKYCYLTCRFLPPFFEHRIRAVYSRIESCQTIDQISHPAVREVLRFLHVTRGIEIHHDGDLPARSGIGSSSAFTVGLLNAVHALHGRMVSPRQLVTESIQLEQEVLAEAVGSQDQVLAAHGGLRHIRFDSTGDIHPQPVVMPPGRLAELNEHLLLFYSGIKRTASSVAASYATSIGEHQAELRALAALVDAGLAVLTGGGDLLEFGRLLHETWQIKARLSRIVSNPLVDEIYAVARQAGAIGGKLLGAGGGGFVLLFARPEDHPRIRYKLDRLVHVPFQFESTGSQIIFFDAQREYHAEELARDAASPRVCHELSELTAA